MKEIYGFNNKDHESIKNDVDFLHKEFIVCNEALIGCEKLFKENNFSLKTIIISSLCEVFARWTDGSGLKLILVDDLKENKVRNIDYKCVVNESYNSLCTRLEKNINSSESISEISSIIGQDIEENEKIIVLSVRGLENDKDELRQYSDNDSYFHNIDLYRIYINEKKIPDAIIQCIVDDSGNINIAWNLNKKNYTEEISCDMELAYKEFLNWINKGCYNEQVPDLMPSYQIETRKNVNATYFPIKKKLLHDEFFLYAEKYPLKEAVLWDENGATKTMTYGELSNKALKLATLLMKVGVKEGELVAITQPRGVNQIISALGILAVGAAYVPVGIKQPKERRSRIYNIGKINYVITCGQDLKREEFPEDMNLISLDEVDNVEPIKKLTSIDNNSLAYVIFTSGSTGDPKGVEITHEAAYNTIADINTKFSLDNTHRTFNVSSFDFDLSVYDVFGMLSVGGSIVLLKEGEEREATIWAELVNRMNVTVWNSVPALFDMLLIGAGDKMLSSLKLVLVSGDWVGLDLHERLLRKTTECKFVSLGGATEASIWSNYYEVEEINKNWKSIPYGKPLSNQCFRVVDKLGRDCPDMIPGELWIGGMGVARGYVGNEELTSKSFVIKDDKRWYRTGDLGRYWSDGIIEFLGRMDHQVKLRGFRIELGEIEAALKQYKGIGQAIGSIVSNGDSKHLVATIVMDKIENHQCFCEEINEDIEKYRRANREKQCEVIERLIIEILELHTLENKSVKESDFTEGLQVNEEYRTLLKMWLQWLKERNVIEYRGERIFSGAKFHSIINFDKGSENNELKEENLEKEISKSILDRLGDYRAILKGDKSPLVLLDDEKLSPESIASKDLGTKEGIKLISQRIKEMSRNYGRPIKVALIGGRDGIMAELLLNLLNPCHIELTILDSASSMIKSAEKRLGNNEHFIKYGVLKENYISEDLRYSYDLALAINSLHRYHNPNEGIALASLLLKNGGKIFALEHCELLPIGLVTAAVLEKGFKDLDYVRKAAFSPMLRPSEWGKLLAKAGFMDISHISINESFTELIEGQCSDERIELNMNEIFNFIKTKLPEHMVPEKIEVLPMLPLTSNGKINRKEFQSIFKFSTEESIGDEVHDGIEKEVEIMWKNLIGVERVFRNDGFFEIGGDSLLATRFIAEVKDKFKVDLSLKNMFEKPCLFEVASKIENGIKDLEEDESLMEEGEI